MMKSVMGFSTAEQNYLYGGGIQTQEAITCYNCGDEIDADAEEIDGEWYCSTCIDRKKELFRLILENNLGVFEEPFEKKLLAEVMEEYIEGLEE